MSVPANEQIGDVVDQHPVATRLGPGHQHRAGTDVLLGQTLAIDAITGDATDACHRHVAPPETVFTDGACRSSPKIGWGWGLEVGAMTRLPLS